MTLHLGILGYPLRHSASPAFQQAALDHLGLDARYEAWEVEPERLAERVRQLRGPDLLGFSVTVPHKETVMPLLDAVDDAARAIGAVNTVVSRDGRLEGANTDLEGFLRALREEGAYDPRGGRALVLGAGGAARAVAYALLAEGAAGVAIANRSPERARILAEELGARFPARVQALSLDAEALAPLLAADASVDLLVNCTSLGMAHGPDPDASPVPADLIPGTALVYDLVYNPQETPLLAAARRAGARTLGGLPMLVYQGAAAFRMWTGREAPIDVMMRAASAALAGG